jgi:hypothetical protein
MERDRPLVSLKEHRNRIGNQHITRVRQDARLQLLRTREQYAQLDEDAYASRLEVRDQIAFLTNFNQKLAKLIPGSVLDLRQTMVDHGYDPEEAAADQMSGIEYVPEADRRQADYDRNLHGVSKFISRLESAGVRVKVGVRRISPEICKKKTLQVFSESR